MRRVAANQRSLCSLELESVSSNANSGAPPPGYTSQRDTTSSVATVNYHDINEGKVILNNSSSPPSMESPLNPMYSLPSPYSTEDLLLVPSEHTHPRVESHEQLPLHRSSTQGCTHGYTHTHSQCTPVSASFKTGSRSNSGVQLNTFSTANTPPVRSSSYYPPQQHQQRGTRSHASCDASTFYGRPYIHSADNLVGANGRSRSSLRPYHRSSMEERPSVQASIPYPHQQTIPSYATVASNDDHNLSSSPYRRHHHRNTYSPPCADIRILSYHSADEDDYEFVHEEDGEEEDADGGRSPPTDKSMMMMMMNSTATILSPSEEPSGYYRSRDSALPLTPPSHRHSTHLNTVNHENKTLDPRQAVTTTTTERDIRVGNRNSTKPKFNSRDPTKSPAKDRSTLLRTQTVTQPTNYVHISRKCTPSKPTSKFWGWRKIQPTHIPPKLSSSSSSSSSSSMITGTFIIDPELYIPPSLLNAMEDPIFRLSSANIANVPGETSQIWINSKRGSTRRTNLRLEVENGGVDADICLVPSVSRTGACIGNSKNRDTFCEGDALVQAQVSPSTTEEVFEKRPQPSSQPHLPTTSSSASSSPTKRMEKNPTPGLSGTPRKEAILKPGITQSPSRRDKKPSRLPTTIDLRIKQTHDSLKNIMQDDSVKINGLPLIARIRAPNPRPPFHLFASTIDIPNRIITDSTSVPREPLSRASSSIPTTMATSFPNNEVSSEPTIRVINTPPSPPRHHKRRSLSKPHPQGLGVSSSHGTFATPSSLPTASPSQLNSVSSLSSSPLYLHLPRTFHGPLTIHISSGKIGERLRLSEGLEREVALIRESEFGRGYFVGGLGYGEDEERRRGGRVRDGEEGDRDGDEDDHDDIPIIHSKSSVSLLTTTTTSPQVEWYGDRIEILAGSGDVYLQFEDEGDDDPFSIFKGSRKDVVGFWKKFFSFF